MTIKEDSTPKSMIQQLRSDIFRVMRPGSFPISWSLKDQDFEKLVTEIKEKDIVLSKIGDNLVIHDGYPIDNVMFFNVCVWRASALS